MRAFDCFNFFLCMFSTHHQNGIQSQMRQRWVVVVQKFLYSIYLFFRQKASTCIVQWNPNVYINEESTWHWQNEFVMTNLWEKSKIFVISGLTCNDCQWLYCLRPARFKRLASHVPHHVVLLRQIVPTTASETVWDGRFELGTANPQGMADLAV